MNSATNKKMHLIWIGLMIVMVYVQVTESCSCLPSHPQEHYCNSDFVILARIKREKIFNDNRIYKVRVRKEYKLSEKAAVALKSGRLITALDSSMCGVNLEVGKMYVITGRVISLKAHINLCGYQVGWENLSRRQRKGFKMLYRHGCTCSVKNCLYGGKCTKTIDSCNWTSNCQTTEGICLRQSSGRCGWTRNAQLSKCIIREQSKNPLTISLWSG